MKKIAIAFSLMIAFAACRVPSYTIGMSETDFKSKSKWAAQVAEQTADHTIYKIQTSFQDERIKRYQFFYFENGKLVRLDEGQAMFGI